MKKQRNIAAFLVIGEAVKKKTKKGLFITLIVVLSVCYFFYFQNNSIVTTNITIDSADVPSSFDDFTIVQLSDLHGKNFGTNQRTLVEKITQANPNLILFTGDLIDSRRYDEENSLILVAELVQIAPIYYVTGNHEWRSGEFSSLEKKLNQLGVQVMRNSVDEITIGTEKIQIIGIDDPASGKANNTDWAIIEETIERSIEGIEEGHFKILLSHRPEWFPLYSEYGFDLVFSGHAHGGQVRLPFVGALFAPNQGFFPKYTSGKHHLENTTLIVNRGLGNSLFPLRIFNRPEIVVVTLKSAKQ